MRLTPVLLSLALASTAVGQTVENQVRREVARFVTAVNNGDARTLASLYLPDRRASSIIDGQIYRGSPRSARVIGDVFGEAAAVRLTTDSLEVVRLGGDAALAVVRYQRLADRSKVSSHTGAMTLTYTRTRRGWRLVHAHTSTPRAVVPASTLATASTDSGPTSPRRETQGCTITRLIDGDTVECARIGPVRLIGMDTPESDQPPFGAQATAALAALMPIGSDVRIETDVDARDQYGRLLAYAWVGRTLVNWRMVREGWALLLTYQPNVQYVEWFIEAERRARDERKGLWATGGFDCRPADRRRNRCE